MDKRQFLKTSGAIITGTLLSRFASGEPAPLPRTNWAGNLTYHTDNLLTPKTVEETQQLVKTTPKLRALGSRHCFNTIADSTAAQISLTALDSMVIDADAKTVTVGAGVRYGNLSTAVSGMEMVAADGQIVRLSRAKDGDSFKGAVVHLGALGVVTKITLDLQPTYQVRQVVYENLSMGQLEHNLDAIFSSGYSVSLFTNWQNHRVSQVWIKSKAAPGDHFQIEPEFYGATAAKQKLHPLPGHDATPCTEQMGVPGPWYERLPHFRMNFTPSSGAEIQTEYFVPRARGYEAILAVEQLKDKITPHLFITELRCIAADDLWMSPAYKQDCMAIHFTWKPESDEIHKVLPLIEEKLAPFNAKPHWGKVFTMPPSRIRQVYENIPQFQTLLKQYDPQGKFRNQFIDANIYGV